MRWAVLAVSLVCSATLARADEPARPGPPTLTVTGRGTSESTPDMATVSVGVTVRAATAGAAIDETSAAAAKVAAAARAFGLGDRDIRTGSVSLQPLTKSVRDPAGGMGQQPDGFAATNNVQLRIRELGRLGEFLRKGVGEGANRIDGLAFGLSDRVKAEREAREAAVADAIQEAQTLARAAGIRLGRIQEIRSASRGSAPRPMRMELRAAASDVPVEPGAIEVAAEIEITWLLEQP